ncbi:MOB kinase activator 2-like isoform X2 [Pecten maximus]|uniref:MOB kinase activator 2-like isoform X2 n=1 Tax=Pecten maximus TaxID=6579 RepID=UPI0014581D09|nr:MOB kinase activator 2-like isoform X2 [Pecten maximus]
MNECAIPQGDMSMFLYLTKRGSRKGRRKDKDSPTPPQQEEPRQYLEDSCVKERVTEADFYKLVSLPSCLDYNEWLATHTLSFFNHITLIYGVISEYCTSEGCPSMSGPGNVQFLWYDEKGKKYKYSSPQYVDFITTCMQKEISDESVFPTKYGNPFPSTFETSVKKFHKYLFHIVAHIYHAHYSDVVNLGIHGHLNSLFTHFTVFNIKFDLMEDKETDILQDLIKALIKQLPDPNQNEGTDSKEISRT